MSCPHTNEYSQIEAREHEGVDDDGHVFCVWEGDVDVRYCTCDATGFWVCGGCGQEIED